LTIPNVPDYNSIIDVYIKRHVAKWLIEIDKDSAGKPIHWTYFMYQITQSASNKYTAKIYKKLCSWRQKGGFTIPMDEFRQWLCIENKYKNFFDVKKYILIPVQNDLTEKADLWFNCKDKDFIIKQGNKTYLNFKIITPDLQETEAKLKDHVFHLLKTHFKFESRNIDQIKPIFDNSHPSRVLEKINDLYQDYQSNTTKIADITGYVTKSLLAEFCSPKIFN
jgi:plasmid replication initiation protein